MPGKIGSIADALEIIGAETLVNFVLASALAPFYRQAQDGYGLEKGELWRHSVGCALAARRVAGPARGDDGRLAFAGGLLHDLGKIVLDPFTAAFGPAILDLVKTERISFGEAEKRILGLSHPAAGARLARRWGLPEPLADAIEYHQDPELAPQNPALVAEAHLGNILCLNFGIGGGAEGAAYTFHPKALEVTGIEVSEMFRLSLDVHDDIRKAEALIGLAA